MSLNLFKKKSIHLRKKHKNNNQKLNRIKKIKNILNIEN